MCVGSYHIIADLPWILMVKVFNKNVFKMPYSVFNKVLPRTCIQEWMKFQMMFIVWPWSKPHCTVLSVKGEFLSIYSTSGMKDYRDKPLDVAVRVHWSSDIFKAFKISIHTKGYKWLNKKVSYVLHEKKMMIMTWFKSRNYQ